MQRAAHLLLLTLAVLAASPWVVHAESAKSLPLGAPIQDGALTIGSRTWTLPPGDWKLAGRHVREVRISETRAGAEVIEAFSARVRGGSLEAALVLTAPTGATQLPSWREDSSCRVEKVLLKEDSSTATLSDCMIIRLVTAIPTQVQGAEVFASAAQWLAAEGIKTPRPVFQVLIVKYVSGEYMRASSWLDPALFGVTAQDAPALSAAPDALVEWVRAYRSAVSSALGKTGGTFQIPPLPSR